MARRKRECYLCGESYAYCGSCSQDRTKPSWMSEFHSENCKTIFDTCTRYNMGMLSKTEAKDVLSACNLTNKANFKSYVIRDLEVIFAEEPKKRGKRIEINPIDEVADIKSHEVVIKENE